MPINNLPSDLSKRYWTKVYLVRGKTIRTSSQWFEKDAVYFVKYLKRIGIDYEQSELESDLLEVRATLSRKPSVPTPRANSRYRGNTQNLLVRISLVT